MKRLIWFAGGLLWILGLVGAYLVGERGQEKALTPLDYAPARRQSPQSGPPDLATHRDSLHESRMVDAPAESPAPPMWLMLQGGRYGLKVNKVVEEGDLDGDNLPDILFACFSVDEEGICQGDEQLVIYTNTEPGGQGDWKRHKTLLLEMTICEVQLLDVNRDGRKELVVTLGGGDVHLYIYQISKGWKLRTLFDCRRGGDQDLQRLRDGSYCIEEHFTPPKREFADAPPPLRGHRWYKIRYVWDRHLKKFVQQGVYIDWEFCRLYGKYWKDEPIR